MIQIMHAGMEAAKAEGANLGSSPWTVQVMEHAPVTILIFNNEFENNDRPYFMDDLIGNSVEVQSIGAAIQTMLLAATDMGLGTLWICDVFYAYLGLCAWLGETHQLIAAVSVGRVEDRVLLDLKYEEDSTAQVDMNVVKTGGGRFVEVQGTAEGAPFSEAEMAAMLALARRGIGELVAAQKAALESAP